MFRSRRVLGAAMLAISLAVPTVAMPASAVSLDAKVVVGHGIPSAVVDICANDGTGQVEVSSNLRFGRHVKLSLLPGSWRFITRVASPGTCKGAVVIKETLDLADGDDLSVIATKTQGEPTYQVFDNTDILFEGPTVVSVKHAAMLGKIDVYFSVLLNETLIPDDAIVPVAAPPTLEDMPKGAQLSVGFLPSDVQVAVAKAGSSKILKQTPYWELKEGHVNHVVAVGGPRNFRFIRYRTQSLIG